MATAGEIDQMGPGSQGVPGTPYRRANGDVVTFEDELRALEQSRTDARAERDGLVARGNDPQTARSGGDRMAARLAELALEIDFLTQEIHRANELGHTPVGGLTMSDNTVFPGFSMSSPSDASGHFSNARRIAHPSAYHEYDAREPTHARTAHVRDRAHVCERGHYCVRGTKLPCPAGRYGATHGLSTALCTGPCAPGYYCPQGSSADEGRELECGGTHVYCPEGSGEPTVSPPGYYTIGGYQNQPGHPENTTRSDVRRCPAGFFCEDGVVAQCPQGTYGAASGLATRACSGPCEPGHFCPPGSTHARENECAGIFSLVDNVTRVRLGHFHDQAEATMDTSCAASMLPVYPTQMFEFTLALVNSENMNDPRNWDVAGNTRLVPINNMEFDEKELAMKSAGTGRQSFIGTGWKPGRGGKTACAWKKYYTQDVVGMDGFQRWEFNDHFMFGMYFSSSTNAFSFAGGANGGYGHKGSAIHQQEWNFFCLSSGGDDSFCHQNGETCTECEIADLLQEPRADDCASKPSRPCPCTSETYVATPIDDRPVLVRTQENGVDRGCEDGPEYGMTYGTTTTFTENSADDFGRRAHSKAFYGGILHFDEHLTAKQIQQVYDVTRVYYPGHGGERDPQQIQCGYYDSNEGAGRLAWFDHTRPRLPTTHLGIYSPAAIYDMSLEGGSAEVFCPEGTGYPERAKPGYYTTGGDDTRNTTRSAQQPCEPGYFCVDGKKIPCPPGTYGLRWEEVGRECSGFCPKGFECPVGTAQPKPCPEGTYASGGFAKCMECANSNVLGRHSQSPQAKDCRDSRKCCVW